jgi:hypothetical protein
VSAKRSIPLLAALLACLLAGCGNPDLEASKQGPAPASVQNAGEPRAPAPSSAREQRPAGVRESPEAALSAFAQLYVNWSYRTLAEHQRSLAQMSVGAARLSETEAAARTAADSTIVRARIYNRGQVVVLGRDQTRSGWWVIVTREQTGGSSQYAGLPAAYHVTRARLAEVGDGFVVEQWLPQS